MTHGPKDKSQLVEALQEARDRVATLEVQLAAVMATSDDVTPEFNSGDDVSDRERLASVRVSEERFRFLTENMADIVWTLDRNLSTTYVSSSIERVLGFTPEERMKQTLQEMVAPESLAQIMTSLVEELARDGEEDADPHRFSTFEVEYYHADGHTVWLENRVKGVRNQAGELVQVYGASRDITDRKRAEDALRESEQKYRILVDHSIQGVAIAQADPFRLSFVNPAMSTLSGYAESELLTMNPEQLAELIHRGDRRALFSNFQRRIAGEERPARTDYRVIHRDGSVAWVQIYSSAITFEGTPATLTVFIDETDRKLADIERKQLENTLREAQKMEAVGRLAGGVAHDFNNVLSAIKGNAEMAQLDLAEEAPLNAAMTEIIEAADRAANLTLQLLAFSRKQVIAPKVINLGQLVENLASMLAPLIGEDVVLRTVPHTPLGSVMADPGQIEQIVVNLAINARDAMPGGGELLIETSDVVLTDDYNKGHPDAKTGAHVMLAVSDTGCGMSPEICQKIYEPFFTTKKAGEGTGMGLATVYGIVEQNNGRIEVYSEPGVGSVFKVYFPMVHEQAETPIHKERSQQAGGTETVLVVEDEDKVRRVVVRFLKRRGYNVLEAACGEDALQVALRHADPIDLLFTDVIMPEMNGRELADRLTEQRPGIKLLFTSGYTHDNIAHRGVLDEGVQFIAKPFSLKALAVRVREVLD